jgi:hypothetical protein
VLDSTHHLALAAACTGGYELAIRLLLDQKYGKYQLWTKCEEFKKALRAAGEREEQRLSKSLRGVSAIAEAGFYVDFHIIIQSTALLSDTAII